MIQEILVFTDVTYSSATATTLSGLSFALRHGEFFAVLGADAAARSAVALLAAGLARPDEGAIYGPAVATAPGIAGTRLVFSLPGQGLIAATVAEEIGVSLDWSGRSGSDRIQCTEKVLRDFGLWEKRDQSPAVLSGGEKQLLAAAAALAAEPLCLILDEPAAMLDPPSTRRLTAAIRNAAVADRGVLWLTGNPEQAISADRLAVLHDGRIVWTGSSDEYVRDEEKLIKFGLPPLPLTVMAGALRKSGIPVSGRAVSPRALVEEICSVCSPSV